MIKTVFHRVLMIPAFGAILVAFSEFWFYQVAEDVSHVGILLAYGILGYLFLSVLERFRVHDFPGFYIAACLLGFLIEGVPVPVVYSGPPITIVWTSMAWHSLLSICVGWVMFKRVMSSGSWLSAACLNLAIGIGLGLWNNYMWNAQEDDVTGVVRFEWVPLENFIDEFLIGYGLFVLGHLVFERVYRAPARFHRFEPISVWFIALPVALLVAAASGLWMFFPVLPALVALCYWALARNARHAPTDAPDFVARLNGRTIPLWRWVLTLLIPGTAIPVYAMLLEAQIGIEMNAVVILTAGPVSVYLFGRALWKVLRARR